MEEKVIYNNVFEEIKNNVSLVSEIESRGISLHPSGRQRLRCRCPFPNHNDGTPSFHVSLNDSPELFYCFGCKKGGSVIDFVMYYGENGNAEFSRKDAIKYLIKKYEIKNLSMLDIDKIASIPNKYKKEELPILSKTLLISEDIRKYLSNSIELSKDFEYIYDYIKSVEDSMISNDYPTLNLLEDLVNKALKNINNKYIESEKKVKTCSLCDLRIHCKNSVFGFGNFNANTFLVGDFITSEESINNRPFSDSAGLFLIEEIFKIGKNPFDFWLTSCQSCSSVFPNLEFAKVCSKEHLEKHISLIKPKNIIFSGNVAEEVGKNIKNNYDIKVFYIEDYRKTHKNRIDSKEHSIFYEKLAQILSEIA